MRRAWTLVLVFACSGREPPPSGLYAAGFVYIADDMPASAAYWHEREVNLLEGREARDIVVTEDAVVVAGMVVTPVDFVEATVWRDGAPSTLASEYPGNNVSGIAVDGEDIHVVGESWDGDAEGSWPAHWKNGEKQSLSDPLEFQYGELVDVARADGHTYILAHHWRIFGQPDNIYTTPRIGYWIDDTFVALWDPQEQSDESYVVEAIAVDGDYVYVVGTRVIGAERTAILWKNGDATELAPNATAADVVIANGSVYVAGTIDMLGEYSGGQAAYWENGELRAMPATDGTCTWSNAIAVDGPDVYVAGGEGPIVESRCDREVGTIRLWKNGERADELAPRSPTGGEAVGSVEALFVR